MQLDVEAAVAACRRRAAADDAAVVHFRAVHAQRDGDGGARAQLEVGDERAGVAEAGVGDFAVQVTVVVGVSWLVGCLVGPAARVSLVRVVLGVGSE